MLEHATANNRDISTAGERCIGKIFSWYESEWLKIIYTCDGKKSRIAVGQLAERQIYQILHWHTNLSDKLYRVHGISNGPCLNWSKSFTTVRRTRLRSKPVETPAHNTHYNELY